MTFCGFFSDSVSSLSCVVRESQNPFVSLYTTLSGVLSATLNDGQVANLDAWISSARPPQYVAGALVLALFYHVQVAHMSVMSPAIQRHVVDIAEFIRSSRTLPVSPRLRAFMANLASNKFPNTRSVILLCMCRQPFMCAHWTVE